MHLREIHVPMLQVMEYPSYIGVYMQADDDPTFPAVILNTHVVAIKVNLLRSYKIQPYHQLNSLLLTMILKMT